MFGRARTTPSNRPQPPRPTSGRPGQTNVVVTNSTGATKRVIRLNVAANNKIDSQVAGGAVAATRTTEMVETAV